MYVPQIKSDFGLYIIPALQAQATLVNYTNLITKQACHPRPWAGSDKTHI